MSLRLPVAALAALTVLYAPAVAQSDSRHDLRLTVNEQALFLSEMRVMLGSVQQIAEGLGRGDRALIIEAARRSGNRMARATPASVRAKVPKTFEELAVRAETDDMDQLAAHLGHTMKQCMACHATFRVR
jgi:hypothetical protein